MIYPDSFEQKIGFDRIRTMLRTLCSFQLGQEQIDKMTFSASIQTIRQNAEITAEMLAVINDPSLTIPTGNISDLRDLLSRIKIEGLYLDETELNILRATLTTTQQLFIFLNSLDRQRFPRLTDFTTQSGNLSFPQITALIDSILDKFGHIKDNASTELQRIRRELTASQGSVSRALNTILRQAQADGIVEKDVTPTLREGRLVIPVPPMYKRKLGGIVHDESASGKTVYIEPTAVVEANNRIRELESEERREIIRILREVSDQIRPHIPTLLDSQLFLGQIDFIHAKARFAKKINAILPVIQSKPTINIRDAIHPLLWLSFESKIDNHSVVPLNIRLDGKYRIVLISGPNAGGKSVCLKTVALLQYMLQCGMLVPLKENSEMGIFKNIFIDIGDEQSIENDLSTYSSHLLNMKFFVRHSSPETLILIDEFGSGTEPQIGGAIAQATLEKLCESKAYGVITTHYQNLKHFAQDTEGIINGAMLYDRQKLQPLFQLSIGKPGSSFAIEIARKTGLPEDIIRKAQDLVGTDYTDYDKHLQDIARDRRYWEQKRQQIHEKEKQLNQQIEHYEAEMAKIKQTRREILDQARDEASDLLRQSNATIEQTIKEIKEAQADKKQTRQARQKVERLKEEVSGRKSEITNNRQASAQSNPRRSDPRHIWREINQQEAPLLSIDDNVKIKNRNLIGKILELNGKKALVAIGDVKTWLAIDDLERTTQQTKNEQKITIRQLNTATTQIQQTTLNFRSQLDVRGMRADEALQAVMYFLDDATMVGAHQVRILHGTGNGILRQLIREYLPTYAQVASFRDEHVDFGGAGITVVELY